MSRDIRFRVWDTVRNRWVPKGDCCNGPFLSLDGTYRSVAVREFTPVVVEQYTGLKDSAGIDIYEGDIVRFSSIYRAQGAPEHLGVIEYSLYSYVVRSIDTGGREPHAGQMRVVSGEMQSDTKYTVVGNIHEQTHLLAAPVVPAS